MAAPIYISPTRLRDLVTDGYRRKDLVKILGASETLIQWYASKHKIKFRRGEAPNVELRARVLALIQAGINTAGKIAKLIGFSRSRAAKIIRELVDKGLVYRAGGSNGRGRTLVISSKWLDDRYNRAQPATFDPTSDD